MKYLLTASALLALCACAKKEEAPAAAQAEPSVAEPAAEAVAPPAAAETAAEPETPAVEEAAMPCPVIDSRNWKAWTTTDGAGTTLHVAGEADFPTPGYASSWRLGISDRAMPPGIRVHLDATPPDGIVPQVVTPTAVSFDSPGAYAEYRVVYVLCGDATLAEISPVTSGAN